MFININSDAVIRFTAKLEQMHRSALPNAVRTSLSGAAFDVKKRTMPATAKVFVHRTLNFFKSQSKVKPAQGYDIKNMQSEVGFLPASGAKESGGATKDLEQQENAGVIGHRAFIPLRQARSGGQWNRVVSNKNRLRAIKALIKDSKDSKGRTKQSRFFSSAMAAGKGGLVIGNKISHGSKMLLRINSISRVSGHTVVNSTPLYSVKGKRAVKIKQTKFMQIASLESAKIIERLYIVESEKQIKRLGG